MFDLNRLKKEQQELSKKIITSDGFEKITTIGGVDQIYYHDTIISIIVVVDAKTFEIIEHKHEVSEAVIPYMHAFLAYREASIIIEAYNKLETRPDILLVAGDGIAHPRRIGLASHVGLLLNQPTIGVAKKLSYGQLEGDKIIMDKEVVGVLMRTRDVSKPIYISPGHKITLKSSIEIVKNTLRDHKLPEPIHLAHKIGAKIKARMKEK